ncbi:MAG TPA: DUF5709 domain-containing protein [Mycobacteriales bacterium]|nr:DUF5709 domain-containing protein [Mycobacteriales bacterium]
MSVFDDQAGWPTGNDTDANLLETEESLDEDELGDVNDTGYSPGERPAFISGWGTTPREASGHEDLSHRLAREVRETGPDDVAETDEIDGIQYDANGEPIGDQVGDLRAGRLVFGDIDRFDSSSDFRARDIGIDGGAASAEEAAVHIVPDDELS